MILHQIFGGMERAIVKRKKKNIIIKKTTIVGEGFYKKDRLVLENISQL